MEQKFKITDRAIAFCFFFICLFAITLIAAASNLRVNLKSGASTSFALSNLKTLSFTGGNLVVNSKDVTTSSFALTNMRYLDFSDVATAATSLKARLTLKTYPNPVDEVLNIERQISNEQTAQLEIIGMNGRVVLSSLLNKATSTISVSTLPKGLYFSRVQHGTDMEACKFVEL